MDSNKIKEIASQLFLSKGLSNLIIDDLRKIKNKNVTSISLLNDIENNLLDLGECVKNAKSVYFDMISNK